jgi:hypothetical protein
MEHTRGNFERYLRCRQWKPGQSGNWRGRPVGAKDKKERARPGSGVVESIQMEREARRGAFERAQNYQRGAGEKPGSIFGSGLNDFGGF